MIIKLLNSPKSAVSSLRYNQEKVILGLGSVLTTNCMSSTEDYAMETALLERENNPDIDVRARKLGFHAAISPGPGEEMSDEKAVELARDYMQDMGYNDQPWVLFKHEDIERVHYHIVGSKVKKDGRLIYDSYTGLNTKKFLRDNAEKYGFVLGKDKTRESEKKLYTKRFSYTKGDIVSQMRHFYKLSLKYNYRSTEDFLTVMRAFGIRTDIRQDGTLGFIGLDKYGKTQGNYIGNIDKLAYSQISAGRKDQRDPEKVEDCRKAVESCLEYAADEKEFISELRKAHIDTFIVRDKRGEVEDIIYVDHLNEEVVHMQDFGQRLTIKDFNTIAQDWKDPMVYKLAMNSRQTSEVSDFIDKLIGNVNRMKAGQY